MVHVFLSNVRTLVKLCKLMNSAINIKKGASLMDMDVFHHYLNAHFILELSKLVHFKKEQMVVAMHQRNSQHQLNV